MTTSFHNDTLFTPLQEVMPEFDSISEFSPYNPVFDPKPVHVGFVVDRAALE
jgi:hypothetical protein